MDHNTLFRIQNWFRSQRKACQSRLVVLILMVCNLVNCLVISLDAVGSLSAVVLSVNSINALSVFIALCGIYLRKPAMIVPDAVIKVCLCSTSLFYTLHLAETGNFTSEYHFIWLLLSYFFLMWELQSVIRFAFDIIKESDLEKQCKPPPSYNQVALEEQPPSYSYAVQQMEKCGSPIAGVHIV